MSDMIREVPKSLDAERAVLSCMLRDPKAIIPEALMDLSDEHFYGAGHSIIFRALAALGDGDPTLLCTHLEDKHLLEAAGGRKYIIDLIDDVPTVEMYSGYRDVLVQKSQLRAVIAMSEIVGRAYAPSAEPLELLKEIETVAAAAVESGVRETTTRSYKEVCLSAVQSMEERIAARSAGEDASGSALPFGIQSIDRMTNGGMPPSTMIVIAARPSNGKTSLLGQIMTNTAEAGHAVGFFSGEMSAEPIILRDCARFSGVDSGQLANADLNKATMPKVMKAMGLLADLPIYIDDRPRPSLEEIEAIGKKWKRDHDIKLLCIDYLQICQYDRTAWDTNSAVSRLSGGFLALAKTLGIPIIVLSQMSRPKGGDESKPPTNDRLRDSGAIEQDAHGIIFLHPSKTSDPGDGEMKMDAIITKWRSGSCGTVPLSFIKPLSKFVERAADPPDDEHDFKTGRHHFQPRGRNRAYYDDD